MVLGFEGRIEDIRAFLDRAGKDFSDQNSKQQKKQLGGNREQKGRKKKDPLRIVRFRNVFAKPLREMAADFVAPVHPKTQSQRQALDEALGDNFIFVNLDSKSREKIVNAMEPIQYPSGHIIIKQGEMGDYMYVLEKGKVKFIVDEKEVGSGEAGLCFGELALLYDCPRAATVVCETDCSLWRVHQSTVRRIKAAKTMSIQKEARELVQKVSFLKPLDEKHKRRIADALERKFFAQGETLVQKGTPCQNFIIIKEGKVKGYDISIGETHFEDLIMEPGDFFGQKLIELGESWIGNATAMTHGIYYSLSQENFVKILGGLNIKDLIAKSREQKLLMAVPILANTDLNRTEVNAMQALITDQDFHKGHVFTKQGQPVTDPAIYVIQKGTITFSTRYGGNDRVLHEGEVFGDDELVPAPQSPNKHQIVAKHTIVASDNVTLGVLSLDEIEYVILDASRLGKKRIKSSNIDSSITLESLEKHNILGAGTFGQVWLVSKKEDSETKNLFKSAAHMKIGESSKTSGVKTPYALKIQYKRDLIGYNQVAGVLNEKTIMAMIDHPFVIRLVNSYKDELRIYMLMQLVQGGELFSLIHTEMYDGIPEDEALFYAAGILEGLSYMHRRSILHRDLKGENVLMDNDGYCVLIDLGFAKVVPDKTYTCCGTPIFMAPEVLLGEGHNHGADLWSLGVLVYDMIVGYTPFYIPGMKQMELYERIIRGKFCWPEDVDVSPDAKNLVQNLLLPGPAFRLGCLARGDLDIRDHSWFKDVDFGKLFRKEIKAPWVPDIKDPFDVSQFDDWSELENTTKERKPLTEKEQELFDTF